MAGWQIPVFNNRRIHLHSWLGDFQPVILVYRGPVSLPVIITGICRASWGRPPSRPSAIEAVPYNTIHDIFVQAADGGGVEA